MTNTKTTKRALLASVVAMLLCFSMLLGTTFAWFTDSVTSANNLIVSGNLDVELYRGLDTTAKKVDGDTALFDEIKLWEPGAVAYENLTVANEGNLALKYQLAINFTDATETADGKTLADVLKVAVIPGGFTGDRDAAKALAYNYSLSTFAMVGELLADADPDVYGIVIYWEPTANDNYYNMNKGQAPLEITLGVNLFATQLASEEDLFGNEYDAGIDMPAIDSSAANIKADGSATMEVNTAPSATTNKTTIDAPEGTFESTDRVEVEVETTNSLFNITSDGGVVASLDITLTVNNEETSADLADGKVFTVTTYISKGLDPAKVSVAYIGDNTKAQPTLVSYDPETGKLVFTTNHFSQYDVSGSALAYDAENDTALTTIGAVIEAAKQENNTVVIPEANKDAINAEIEKLPEEEQAEAIAATSAAKIGETTYATLTDAIAALKDGDTLVLLNNAVVDADNTVNIDGEIVIDLNGKTLSGISDQTGKNRIIINVVKGGDLTVKNGVVTMEHKGANMGWNNSTSALEAVSGGKLTLENVVVKNLGGSDMAYGVNVGNNGGATLNIIASTIESANYVALRVFNNADGDINIDMTESSVLTGASSPFFVHFWTEADLGDKQEARQACLKVNFNDTKITRYSGSKSLLRYGFTNAIYYSDSTLTEVVAGNATALVWALENDKNVLLNNDIKIDPANMSNAYGKTGINVKNGQTIDGNGYVLDIKGAGGTWDSGINTTGGVIKNITVTGSFRGIFINHNSTESSRVILENVTTDGTVYTISCDQGTNNGLSATNCTFNGWTSFAATLGDAEFINCSFGEGSGYAYCRPYAPTTFVGCDFEAGFEMDPRAAVTFENCTIDGVALTADNLSVLVTSNIANATVK